MFEPWKNGNIVDIEVRVGEGNVYGASPHFQVDEDADAEALKFLNAALEAFHSTERVGTTYEGDPIADRYRPVRSVLISRSVDDTGRVYYSVIASQ